MADDERDKPANGVQVIGRAVAILRTLKHQDSGLSLGQIAEKVSLPRSTVQRLVDALKAERLVIAASPDGGIRLGRKFRRLRKAAASTWWISAVRT